MDVIFEPVFEREYFDAKKYNWPTKPLGETANNLIIVIDGDASDEDIGAFISSLLHFNNIELFDEPFLNSLILKGETALVGGIQVRKGKKSIYPSCCCDMNSITEWEDCILNKQGIWFGHDPSPEMSFDSNIINLWSDEESFKDRFLIQFTEKEALLGIKKVFNKLKEFVNRIGEWSETYTSLDRKEVERCFSIYLMEDLDI